MRRATVGRYRDAASALQPGDLPPEGKAQNGQFQVKHGAIDDPNPALRGKRQKVAINVKTDALENEYAYGRISEAAYRAALAYQHVLALGAGKPSGGAQWQQGDRVDVVVAQELSILRGIDNADRALNMVREALPIIGMLGAKVMHMVLIERLTLTDVAMGIAGKAERMQVNFYAETFRQSCEQLAEHWSRSIRQRC